MNKRIVIDPKNN